MAQSCPADADIRITDIAIVEFLNEQYDHVWPSDTAMRAKARNLASLMHVVSTRRDIIVP